MKMFKIISFVATVLFSTTGYAAKLCQSQYTMLHYAKTECRLLSRPYRDNESFHIQSMLIKADHPTPESRPYMFLIPGGPGESSEGLRALLQKKEILNAFYRHLKVNIVLFDPRGTGESRFPDQTDSEINLDSSNMSFKLLVEDFEALVESYGVQKVIVASHSIGSFTALKYAEAHPNRLSHLVLISPSEGIKGLGDTNLAFYGKDFPVVDEHLSHIQDAAYVRDFRRAFNYVNEVSFQQQKAQILKINDISDFKGISLFKFRKEFFKRLGNIKTKSEELLQLLLDVESEFKRIESQKPLVTEKLLNAKVKTTDLKFAPLLNWAKIANYLICSESISEADKDRDSIYDGLKYRIKCPDNNLKHKPSTSDTAPFKVKTPTLILTGLLDTQVPFYIQKRLADQMENSKQIVFKDEGHFPARKESFRFYSEIESFLN